MINQSIFKAYDIRGIYLGELDEKSAYQIGRAFSAYLKENSIGKPEKAAVGYDSRISSPILKRSFIEGILDEGIDVWDIGLATVDMVYFVSGRFHLPAAMITASHNPKNWNGFKLMKGDIEFFPVEDLEKIIKEKTGFSKQEKGEVAEGNIKNDFLKHILTFADIDNIRPMRVAIDAGSGAIEPIVKSIFEKLPLEMDAGHYHFGCAFDSDDDRAVFTDEKGEKVDPSIIGALMARYFLKRNPYGKIVYGTTASKIISDIAGIYGGEAIRERVGHIFIKTRLKELNGIFGVEASGHYYFKNNFYADSGIISFLTMLNILSREKKSLSVLASEFSKYVSIPETNFKIKNPREFIEKIAEHFKGYDTDWLDGLTVRTADFWLNLRPSNTEPLVRLNIEAKNELVLNRIKDDLLKLMEEEKSPM